MSRFTKNIGAVFGIFAFLLALLWASPAGSGITNAQDVTSTPKRGAPPTNTPRANVIYVTPTAFPTAIPTMISTNVPGANTSEQLVWPPPDDINNIYPGNFIFQRPFGAEHITYWARNYSYGSTDRGTRKAHHGIDFPNPSGVQVIAAGPGRVFFAGPDINTLFGPQPNFYGNVIVIQHPYMTSDGDLIYTLYGHLKDIIVQQGEDVEAGQLIGFVGSTGVALGAHLHFEVRVGDPYPYENTRNPELWLTPYANSGVLAARVTDINGNLLEGVRVEIRSPGVYLDSFSYTGISVKGDITLRENLVIPDVPGGWHTVTVSLFDDKLRFRRMVYIFPGQVTFINIPILP
jgi:murein DD-endopeptidase MepM/ murein hydrolase activator NlpD